MALVGDGAGEPGLAGAGRAVEQHALRRVDPQPLEQLGIAERQLHHLAHLVHRRAEAADVVIGDVGPAAAVAAHLAIFRAQLDLGVGVDVDDALGHGRHHREADLLEREGGRVQHGAQRRRHVALVDPLLAGGRHHVAGGERPHPEAALQRLARALEPQILLGRREHHPLRRLRHRAPDLDILSRADAGIGALEAVQPQDVQPLVLGIGQHRARGRRPLAHDLHHVALGEAERRHGRPAQPREAASRIIWAGIGHLQLACFAIRHRNSSPRRREHRKPASGCEGHEKRADPEGPALKV